MNKNYKLLFSALAVLTAAILCASLAACKSEPAVVETTTEEETVAPAPDPLDIVKDGKTDFTLVVGRYADFYCDKMCYEIKDALAGYGAEIAVSADYDLFLDSLDIMVRAKYLLELESLAQGKEPGRFLNAEEVEASYDRSAPYEILVGETDREESIRAAAELKDENSYIVRTDGHKIVIAANSKSALKAATEAFIAGLPEGGGDVRIDELDKKGVAAAAEYPEKLFFGMTQKEIDESFSELLDGLFTGKTREEIYRADIGKDFAMHFPDIIIIDGQYRAYYISYASPTAGAPSTGLAVSDNGLDWTPVGQTINPSASYDNTGCAFAGVWEDEDGILYLVYEGSGKNRVGEVCLAVSFDGGESWIKEGVIYSHDADSLRWCSINVGTPDLYKSGDTWYLTFHGFGNGGGNGGCQIGVAYGTSLRNLTVLKDPVIPTEKNTPWSGTTGRRDVLKCGEYYYMVYEVSTEQVAGAGYGGAHWSHMFARSKDMINWEISEGPQLVQPYAGFGNDGPCWCVCDGKLYVFMRNVTNCTTAVALVPVTD